MHTIRPICIFDFMFFRLSIIKFINFKPIVKFKKFELHNYGAEHHYNIRRNGRLNKAYIKLTHQGQNRTGGGV